MKRNIILLAIVFVGSIILWALSNRSSSLMKTIRSHHVRKESGIEDLYRGFLDRKITSAGLHPKTNTMISQNLDDGEKSDPAYFGQDVYNHVNDILQNLGIKNESRELPQISNTKSMMGFDYIKFEIEVSCSFEKFGQFVNRLEKNNKIFMIDRFEFSNTLAHGVQKARSNNGVFPDKKIKMRLWAINLEKKK